MNTKEIESRKRKHKISAGGPRCCVCPCLTLRFAPRRHQRNVFRLTCLGGGGSNLFETFLIKVLTIASDMFSSTATTGRGRDDGQDPGPDLEVSLDPPEVLQFHQSFPRYESIISCWQGLKSSFVFWEIVARTLPSWEYFTHNLSIFHYIGLSVI